MKLMITASDKSNNLNAQKNKLSEDDVLSYREQLNNKNYLDNAVKNMSYKLTEGIKRYAKKGA